MFTLEISKAGFVRELDGVCVQFGYIHANIMEDEEAFYKADRVLSDIYPGDLLNGESVLRKQSAYMMRREYRDAETGEKRSSRLDLGRDASAWRLVNEHGREFYAVTTPFCTMIYIPC